MAKIIIDAANCQGCALCIDSCATHAISISNGLAQVNMDLCVLCSICRDSCPFSAITLSEPETAADCSPAEGVLVFTEQHQGKLLSVAFELLGIGRVLADKKQSALIAVLFGASSRENAGELVAAGADRVLIITDSRFDHGIEADFTHPLYDIIEREKPEIVLIGATDFGRALAPWLAARLRTGLTADCTGLDIDQQTGLLQQTRPAFGGNLMAQIVCPKHRPQMATVRPKVMTESAMDYTRQGRIIELAPPSSIDITMEILQTLAVQKQAGISDAEIIVSAGKGIGSAKNLVYVHEFADLIGAEVGVSRPLVDMGWSEYSCQIGQTGSTVAPRLLIACGISGAIQHLAGISRAETIIAINSDPDAPIFSIAHYKVVGDCIEILQELIKNYKSAGRKEWQKL